MLCSSFERGLRKYETKNYAGIKIREGEGGGALRTGAEIPLYPIEKTVVVLLQPMENRCRHPLCNRAREECEKEEAADMKLMD